MDLHETCFNKLTASSTLGGMSVVVLSLLYVNLLGGGGGGVLNKVVSTHICNLYTQSAIDIEDGQDYSENDNT